MMKKNYRQIHIWLSEKIYKELRVKCIYEDTSMQKYLARLITDNLEDDSNKNLELDVTSIYD